MTPKRALPISLLSILAIGLSLLVLAFLPPLLRQRRFDFDTDKAAAKATASVGVPLDLPLKVIRSSKEFGATVGSLVTLKDLMAHHPEGLIVNFWATWCPPCIEEFPSLEFLGRELSLKTDAHLPSLVTISVDENEASVSELYKSLDFKPSFLVLHDPQGVLSRKSGTSKYPETYWVGSDGKTIQKWVGPQNWLNGDVVGKLSAPQH